jgi:hypothetical protein
MDSLLQSYIGAPTEQSAENYLAWILSAEENSEANRPISKVIDAVRRAVLACWRVHAGPNNVDFVGEEYEAAESTFCEARLRIMLRLRHLRAASIENLASKDRTLPTESITDLVAYAYRTTMHVAADILRETYPDRYRLDCALRYTARNSTRLAVWYVSEGNQKRKQMVGLQQWHQVRSENSRPFQESVYHAYLEAPRQRWGMVYAYHAAPESLALEELSVLVLTDIGGPIPMREFRYICAGLRVTAGSAGLRVFEYDPDISLAGQDAWRMPDESTSAYSREQTAGRIGDVVMLRAEADFLWKEICLLPSLQRRALLLNPRGANIAGDIITLLVTLGIATESQIAASMEMNTREFAQIWQEMPLEDTVIARRLMPPDSTGRDVSNLRKSAIDRLSRRRKSHNAPESRSQ